VGLVKTVSEVARLARVSVRTLHHYDEIGLLRPSGRSEAGYRLYSHDDLVRLHEILTWRELGFALAEVCALLDEPGHDRGAALRRQRELVAGQRERLASLAAAVDAALAAHESGAELEDDTMFEGFDHARYEDEARRRWGDTPEFAESLRRTRSYGEADWAAIRAEADAIGAEFAALMEAGVDPAGAEARALAERHRAHISRWFYDCSPQVHRGLAELYVADPRFARSWDRHAPGLARYVRDAIAARA
jgi:MerR family transcriptional regulator, thiopeptide resistance regulator